MYGGSVEDYLPDVEINSAIVDVYRVFADLGTQWRVDGTSGTVTGLEYSSVPFVLSCHDMKPSPEILRDLRIMEAAALSQLNKKE